MHVGILGGSFNPSHQGHCYISSQALNRLGLDQLWWVITPQNPLKSATELLPLQQRYDYANKIISDKRIKVKIFERSNKCNYSYLLINN